VIFTNAFSFTINIWIMFLSAKYARQKKAANKEAGHKPGHSSDT
jgi:hypothetical protein